MTPRRVGIGACAILLSTTLLGACNSLGGTGVEEPGARASVDQIATGAWTATAETRPTTPRLDAVLQILARRDGPALQAEIASLEKMVPFKQGESGPKVQLFVQRSPGVAIDWAALQADTVRDYGNVFTAYVPVDRLSDLAQQPGLLRARAGRFLRKTIDLSVPATGANRGISLPSPGPTMGTGAIVGVVDTGVDWTHDDFKVGGVSRIISSWDQATNNFTNPSAGDAGHCDTDGHGTHVTSTAAGNGNADPGSNQVGVAAGASIVAVRTTFSDADIAAGVDHVFTKAAAVGKPAAVNLSLGGHIGPHDGTDPFELAMDGLSGPGKIVIAAAGNEGLDMIHAGGDVNIVSASAGSGNSFEHDHNSTGTYAYVDSYYDAKAELNVWLKNQNGTTVAGPLPRGFQSSGTNFLIQHLPVDPVNGKSNIFVRTFSQNTTSRRWKVVVAKKLATDPDMHLDGWVGYSDNFAAAFTQGGSFKGNSSSTIGAPATALSTISVAAYVTRNGGGYGVVPQLAGFSSRGPTADGRPVDIAAPGSLIIAALSSALIPGHTTCGGGSGAAPSGIASASTDHEALPGNILITPKAVDANLYQSMQGTSMATPHVTGLVALMLEKDPLLSPDGVRALLSETARFDGDETAIPGTLPDDAWGAGKATAGPKGSSVGVLAATDVKLPRLTGPSVSPAGVGAGTTAVAFDGTFSPRNPGAARRFQVHWQRKRITADCGGNTTCLEGVGKFFDIAGAYQRELAPGMFVSGDVLRAVMTPFEIDVGYRIGRFAGADSVLPSFTVTAVATPAGHAPEVGWNLISFPAQGASSDGNIANFAGAQLWRWSEALQSYQTVTNTGATDVTVGQGLFAQVSSLVTHGALATSDSLPSQNTDVTLTGLTFTSGGAYAGRQLIGNPFNKRIFWQNLKVRPAAGGAWVGVTSAAAAALIQPVYYAAYANPEGQYLMYGIGGLDGTINPWQAIWILVKQAVDIQIPAAEPAPVGPAFIAGVGYPTRLRAEVAGGGLPAGESGDGAAGAKSAGVSSPTVQDLKQQLLDLLASRWPTLPAWTLGISASSGRLRDDFNYVGLHRSASDDYDVQDLFDGGTLGSSYLLMYIDRTARTAAAGQLGTGRFCQDIQKLDRSKTHTWPLTVKSNGLSEPATLTWGRTPEGWKMSLLDDAAATAVDMTTTTRYTFAPAAGPQIRTLMIEATPPR